MRVNDLFQISLDELMNVEVVSATGTKQNIKDAPSMMTVITAKQIRERGYQSIAEAIRTVPGLSLWVDNLISNEKNFLGLGIDYTTEDQQLQNNYLINRETGEETLVGASQPQSIKNFDNFGVFTQAVYYLTPEIELTGGLRFDFHNRYDNSTSCRIGIIDHISDKLYLKVLYGTSFKPPTQRQLFDPYSGGESDTRGNEYLSPQYARTLETLLGFKLSENLQGKLGGFYTRIKDGIELYPFADSGVGGGYT